MYFTPTLPCITRCSYCDGGLHLPSVSTALLRHTYRNVCYCLWLKIKEAHKRNRISRCDGSKHVLSTSVPSVSYFSFCAHFSALSKEPFHVQPLQPEKICHDPHPKPRAAVLAQARLCGIAWTNKVSGMRTGHCGDGEQKSVLEAEFGMEIKREGTNP